MRRGSFTGVQDYSSRMAVSQAMVRQDSNVPDHGEVHGQVHGLGATDDAHDDQSTPAKRLTVLVYSDDRQVRAALIRALGPHPTPDLPEVDYVECATAAAAIALVDRGGFDLLILDGEAAPTGGAGLARQLKDEIFDCPPVLVLIARPQDAWLATWSRADAVAMHPVNALTLPGQVAGLLRAATQDA